AFNMCFINPLTGWVLKSFGTDPFDANGAVVYKTTNGGLNWQKIILSQVPKDMGGQIQFIDENNGYASIVNTESGLGKYYKTTDGGTTWSLLPSDGTVGIFYSVDLNNAWGILGTFSQTPPFKILHSNNGMASFTEQKTDNSPGAFWAIQFTDLNHGWVVGQKGKILKTIDGIHWDPVTNTGITSDYTCKSVYFMNATTGWIGAQLDDTNNKTSAASNDTKVIHTTDGGANWTTQSTPTLNPYSIFFWDANNGWLTSDDNKIARFTGTLTVKENIVNKFITIYPNPNTGTFNFSLKDTNSKIQVEIYNLSGQKVYEASNFEIQPQNEVNFAPQSKGIYLIKITDGENSYSEKIMIK
ncbi:MAG TPA: T9SS type A sorting domain-containing protein, partial [Flavobacterium sp.]|nr:T9SS type A sorting domain-containing protein [Flavobacterium sp.]